ncbi:putative rna polymerase ii transcription factor siii subunit a [Diaporthe ampelina]|uniref:Putative rna polymerase ii transcription factor siii subunit a n=1 Tax=Diaporthe ampelina TaxID=1214573 RepID=A0A0G2HCQ8_9PEZI|nr:putative rna polymerase ii transcription factor siii subunit a [Diaporthe ampelina]
MPVPTLAGLCRRVIWDNIDELSYVSTLPYWKVRDILKQVKTATQLAVIEEYSPQIVGEDAELWEAFCKRDFRVPMKREPYLPENSRSWRQVYEHYAEEERKKEALALEQLGATYAGLNKMKMANKTAIGDPRQLPKAPSSGGFGRSRGKGPGPGSATLTFGGGARTSNAVQKAKKEAQEAAARKRLSVPKTMRPTAHLAKVTKAPESMKAEFRIKAQPKFISPSAPTVAKRPREEDEERGQMEARLLAAKRPKVQPKIVSDEELRSGSFKSGEGSKLAATPRSESKPSTTPKKPRSLFSRPQSASTPQSRVTIKTVGKPSSDASPEKTGGTPKMKAGPPGSVATNNSSWSAGNSASPPTQRPYRQEIPRIRAVTRPGNDLSPASRVSSPGCEDYKPSRIAPKRASRSPSVTSSVFGSPEPEAAPGPSGQRSSFKSNSSRSSSPAAPPPARPAKRADTPPAVAAAHEARSSSPPKRRLDEAPTAAEGGAAAHPPVKKKKVDIFMRRKR